MSCASETRRHKRVPFPQKIAPAPFSLPSKTFPPTQSPPPYPLPPRFLQNLPPQTITKKAAPRQPFSSHILITPNQRHLLPRNKSPLPPLERTPSAPPPHQSNVLGRGGMGCGEGRGNLSSERFPLPSPIFYPFTGRGPKMSVPTRTKVAPSSTACTQSPDMPMESSGSLTPRRVSRSSRSSRRRAK